MEHKHTILAQCFSSCRLPKSIYGIYPWRQQCAHQRPWCGNTKWQWRLLVSVDQATTQYVQLSRPTAPAYLQRPYQLCGEGAELLAQPDVDHVDNPQPQQRVGGYLHQQHGKHCIKLYAPNHPAAKSPKMAKPLTPPSKHRRRRHFLLVEPALP